MERRPIASSEARKFYYARKRISVPAHDGVYPESTKGSKRDTSPRSVNLFPLAHNRSLWSTIRPYMLYFSELEGKRVVTDGGAAIGKLTDLVFRAQDQPLITKLIIKTAYRENLVVPVIHLKKLNETIQLHSGFQGADIAENELYINKNLLDQQILDINGNKLVRVNDVVIQDKPQLLIAGVDIGILGIIRWFPGELMMGNLLRRFGITPVSQFLSWADIQPLELARGKVVLKKEEHKLKRLLPEDLADHLENMSIRNVTRVINIMDEKTAADVIESLNLAYQQGLFKQFTPERSAKLIERVDPDEAVDILLALPEKKRDQIIGLLSRKKHAEITSLLSLSKTPIGGLMTPEYFTVRPEDTAGRVLARIKRETNEFSTLRNVYVINADSQLVGVASLHELIMQNHDAPLYKFMVPSVVVVYLTTPVEIAIKKMLKYKIESLPVMNDKKAILGIVTFDDLASAILEKL